LKPANPAEVGKLKTALLSPLVLLKPGPSSPLLKTTPGGLPQVVSAAERILDRPMGQYALEALHSGASVKLRGRVKTLKVQSVDGGSTLDASELEAKEIVVTGSISGRSTVLLHAPGGSVKVLEAINGESIVEVRAPGGRVTVGKPAARSGAIINGESQVGITGRVVTLLGGLNGTFTHVTVTLSRGGRLEAGAINGRSRLDYRLENRGDPAPFVQAGPVQPGATLRRIE
jgi:hypothetical protein